ncbi:hypothetical protein GQ53DRAFT_728866 [Thozetella sp. PMI_491]|nr:hypothetical protein GQ53DRAFT_728866 [Thozetella sp. PMI_491]
MTRFQFFLFLFAALASLVAGAAPTFCKCTCFSNSTIIELTKQPPPAPPVNNPPGDASTSPLPAEATGTPAAKARSILEGRATSASCAECNRKFCLGYNLPFCKDAEEKDVLTSCFQRDSRKDQIIVWGFILGTTGLLGWAGIRRLLESRGDKALPFGVSVPGVAIGARARQGVVSPGVTRRTTGMSGGLTGGRGLYSPLSGPTEGEQDGRGLG